MPRFYRGRRIVPPEDDPSWMHQTLGTEPPPPPAKPSGSMKRRGPLAQKRIGPGGEEETEEERGYRVASKPQLREAAKTNSDVQCQWCGLVVQGPRKGPHTRMLSGNVTSYHCPGCAVERKAAIGRGRMRYRMQQEGIPEAEWPPEILSRLERQTGINPQLPYDPESPEPPVLYDLKPLEEL